MTVLHPDTCTVDMSVKLPLQMSVKLPQNLMHKCRCAHSHIKKKKKKVVPKTPNTCSLKAMGVGALIGLLSVMLQKHPELMK